MKLWVHVTTYLSRYITWTEIVTIYTFPLLLIKHDGTYGIGNQQNNLQSLKCVILQLFLLM